MIRRLVEWLIGIVVPLDEQDGVFGDLAEEAARRGDTWRARVAYLHQGLVVCGHAVWERVPGVAPPVALLGDVMTDFKWAARSLARRPAVALVASLTLAIGIGAAVAIFSAVYPVLFAPLPYPDANRILLIADFNSAGQPLDTTYGTFRELEARSESFAAMGAADLWTPALTADDRATERITGQRVTPGYLRALGVLPAAGRNFTDADCLPNGPHVVIVSAGLSARVFGDATGIVGRHVRLNAVDYEIVGVMPDGFENVLAPAAEVWAPVQYPFPADFQSAVWGHHIKIVGRLRSAVSADAARREIDRLARAPIAQFARPPWASLEQGMLVSRLQDDVTRDIRPTLVALLGAVGLVLIIACVNVTNLLLARGAERRGELALRAALGAGRVRLARYLLVESLVLAVIGGVLGWAVAHAGVSALVALSPADLPRVDAIRLNTAALIFALVVTTVTGLTVGLAPAFGGSRAQLLEAVQASSVRTTTGRHLIRRALVVTEVALALVLLVGAGLLWRSVSELLAVSPGFDAGHLLTMQVQLVGLRYNEDAARLRFFSDALDAVRAVPGVSSAALTNQLPLSGDFESYGVQTEATATISPDGDGDANRYVVTEHYFTTMRIPLKRGRLFDARDRPGAPEGVIVSESFARSRYPGQDPIGQRVRFGPEMRGDHPWDVIVGVVGDVRQASLALRSHDAFYVAAGQWEWVDNLQSLIVRTPGDPAGLAAAVKQAIWSVDKNQAIIRVSTMSALVERSESQRRFALTIFRAFGGVALGLAAIGMFGVLSASVTERRREMGVRAALGASRPAIVRLVIGQGLVLTSVGVTLGIVGAILGTSAIRTLLFGVSRLDLPTYLGVIGLLGAVSILACWLPAWRASRVDPIITLRAE